MIEISRNLARQLRTILRKAGASRTEQPVLELNWSQGELRVRAQLPEVAIEYREPRSIGVESCFVSFEALDHIANKSSGPIHFAKCSGGVEAQWNDRAIPQRKIFQVDAKSFPAHFPEVKLKTMSVVNGLLPALANASQCAKGDHVRYSTDKIQLRGQLGEVIATDGRQALIQNGFDFPWKDDLLVPSLALFANRELLPDLPASVGKTDTHLAIKIGDNWTIFLSLAKEGRYPNVVSILPKPTSKSTTWLLSPQDAAFLAHSLEKLPGNEEDHAPVTVDLNGQAVVRAKEEGQTQPTELVLAGSEITGPAVRFQVDRQQLARAVSFGLTEFTIISPDVPILAKDANRTYVFVPLSQASAIPPSKNAIRITSQEETNIPKPIQERMNSTMANFNGRNRANNESYAKGDAHTNSNGQINGIGEHADNSTPSAGNGLGALIAEAQSLKEYFHEGYTRASHLHSGLKRHRKQSKIVASTLASLKQLQQIEG